MSSKLILAGKALVIGMIGLSISACGVIENIATPTATPFNSPIPTITQTSIPPTATPIPMAAIVNGVGITMDEYEAELNRYLSAFGTEIVTDQSGAGEIVLEDLIIQTLLAQAAEENGFTVSGEILQEKMENLVASIGGELSFENWLLDNGYTQQSFEKILVRSILGAWLRDEIIADIPEAAEQVHVRQFLFLDLDQADQVLRELDSGKDFATLAASYDQISEGDLGWFPKDFLPHPEIEEVAFNLAIGEYSPVIETSVGYHIIQVVEKDPNRRLSPEARLVWQETAIRDWVAQKREQSDIVIFPSQ
jgi:parvulin-like peptidyl-prolyl isomerase